MEMPSHRVLYTIPNFLTAGSGQVVFNLASRLDRRRYRPAVCVLKRGGSLAEEVVKAGMELLDAPFTVPPKPYVTLLPRAFRAAAPFRARKFVLWHSFHYADDYTEPLIARFAGARVWVYTKKAMGWGSRAWKVRSHLATWMVADNTDMPRTMFAPPRLRSKVSVIPHGVQSERFRPLGERPLRLREQRGVAADQVVAGVVAHLVPVKGHPTLVQGLARVLGLELFLAGKPMDEAYTASLHRLAGELGLGNRVHFLGGVSDVPALLAEVDIFAFPSRMPGEGCPVALLEAMACGKACVATDIPGSRDLIEHGRSGLLVPPEDPEALAAALRRLAESPGLRRQLGDAARQRVLDQYTIEREVAAHEALYAEILGLNGG